MMKTLIDIISIKNRLSTLQVVKTDISILLLKTSTNVQNKGVKGDETTCIWKKKKNCADVIYGIIYLE